VTVPHGRGAGIAAEAVGIPKLVSAVYHKLYGLLLASNEALPGLPEVFTPGDVPDVRVRLRTALSPLSTFKSPQQAFYTSTVKDENGDPALRACLLGDGKHLVLLYCDGTRFALESHGKEVFVDWPDPLTLEDVAPYLVGPVLGVVLRLRGTVPLHASAAAVGDFAVALAGPAGAGKSTTAAAFARAGYRVISDDVVALQEECSRFVIPPGYPRVNLWMESAQAIVGDGDTLPLISPGWDKHFLPLDPDSQFETRPLPLGAIYVLQRHESAPGSPVVEELTGAQAFVALLANTYMNYLPDPERRRREFELLGRVVASVPIRRVRTRADLSTLANLCEAIAADARSTFTDRPVPSESA
jgi:hypothetical protein